MRSYYEHLETATGTQKKGPIPHPTLRSSAIFPVFQYPDITSRILFMGYWVLKRNIKEILAVVTLRSQKGEILGRRTFPILYPRTYEIELADELEAAGMPRKDSFVGSLEVEFFAAVPLVFPFPAVVINYYGPRFSTVVHTAQRVYNDFEDMQRNSQTDVPESGFNIYADKGHEPFVGLINGPVPVENGKISFAFYNQKQELLEKEFDLGRVGAYETRILYPARDCPLEEFLGGLPGAAKARFHVNWIFPRLVVGNLEKGLPAMAITHTYYDTTKAVSDSDYWRAEEPDWHPASLMVPVKIHNDHFTNVYFYPILPPTKCAVDVEFYDEEGRLLGLKKEALLLESPHERFSKIEMKPLCQELNVPSDAPVAARIVARTLGGSRLPARVKLGLDLGADPKMLPCNICTNLHPFNPDLEKKPTTFRWAPILADQPGCSVWIMNSSPHKVYTRTAEVHLSFFREKDEEVLTRTITINPHGFRLIYPNEDPELREFFEGTIGWFTAVTSNPYTTTYYFAENPSGIVGGDHGF